MPKFCANLSTLFTEHDFLDRFGAAAAAGFSAVEIQFPYIADVAAIRERLQQHQLQLVLHNLPAGDWGAGDRGIACQADRRNEFREGVDIGIEYATALGCDRLNILSGIAPADVPMEESQGVFVDNILHAAEKAAPHGIRVMIEAANTQDIPGFFLHGSEQALAIVTECRKQVSSVFMQYDIYHMQIMEGNLAQTITRNLDRIGHIQFADNPARHEPGSGEINFDFLFRHLDDAGYQGWLGCEYFPLTTTTEGLDWFKPYASR